MTVPVRSSPPRQPSRVLEGDGLLLPGQSDPIRFVLADQTNQALDERGMGYNKQAPRPRLGRF